MKFVSPIASLREHIASMPKDRPALLDYEPKTESQVISYGELQEQVAHAAAFLSEHLKKGDVLALAMSNSPQLLILSWAAWAVGIVTAPLDVKRDTGEQHNFKLKETKATLLIAQKGFFNEHDKSQLMLPVTEIEGIPESKAKVEWEEGLSHDALILFTSGTTSHPKGALLTLENLIANAEGIQEWFKIQQDDRFLVQLPLHHINSTTFCLAALLAGASIAIPAGYSKSRFWQTAADTKSTFTSLVPTICFDQLVEQEAFLKAKDKVRLNRIQIGSAPVLVADVQQFMKQYGIKLFQGYGQTETALRVTGVPLDADDAFYDRLVEENCIGVPMKWAEVKVVKDNGELCKEGEEGELAVKGPVVMKCYLNNNSGFRDDWFMTGDLGYVKEIEGKPFFYLKGRIKEIIIKGGINISPVAVEDAVKRLCFAAEQVYVVGVEDKRYGEEVGAVVVWKGEPAMPQLKHALLTPSDILSEYETPQYVTAITPEELPTTSTGKVQRSVLKEKNLPFEKVNVVATSADHEFVRLTQSSQLLKEAHQLYNHCWQPLEINREAFKEHVAHNVVIAAVSNGKVEGLISCKVTDKTQEELSSMNYSEVAALPLQLTGKTVVCISVCSSSYVPRDIPEVAELSGSRTIEAYIPTDPIMKFHAKEKGGIGGADIVAIIPGGRPEDKRALGYTVLVAYPELSKEPVLGDGPVSVQLIEAAMKFAYGLRIQHVLAYSRPIGLGAHIASLQR